MLGDDEPATRIRSYLRDYGVRLVESPSAHGTSRAISDRTDGEPRYEFNEAAKRRGIRFDEATRAALDEADLVVVSCFPFDYAAQYGELVDAIERPEERVVVDGNPRSGMLADRAAFLANFEDFASRSLLAKVGDEDAELLLGDSLDAFVERLLSRGPGAVLATAGRDGATVYAGDRPCTPTSCRCRARSSTRWVRATRRSPRSCVTWRGGVPTTNREWAQTLHEAMVIAAATVRHEGALLRMPHHDAEPVFPS